MFSSWFPGETLFFPSVFIFVLFFLIFGVAVTVFLYIQSFIVLDISMCLNVLTNYLFLIFISVMTFSS